MNYTPEPWGTAPDDPEIIVAMSNPGLSLLSTDKDGFGAFFLQADADRTVACVNACTGVSTEELLFVGGHWGSVYLSVRNESIGFKKQRDKLLVAAKELVNLDDVSSAGMSAARKKVRDLIAEIEGAA